MALNKQLIKQTLFDFLKSQNETVQENPEDAIDKLAEKLSEVIVDAIMSADLTIKPGLVSVLTATPGTPSLNPSPLFIPKPLK